jgi:hypothetical protein
MKNAAGYLDEIAYKWEQKDSIVYFDEFYSLNEDEKWRFPEVGLILSIPENKVIYLSEGMQDILGEVDNADFYLKDDMADKRWIMTKNGLKLYNRQSE